MDALAPLVATCPPVLAGLPDLDRIREILERIQQILVMGGVALAAFGALCFLGLWVVSFARRPAATARVRHPIYSGLVGALAYVPAGLSLVAGLGIVFAPLAPFVLKALAAAIVVAAVVWLLCAAGFLMGGTARDLARLRRAALLAGTPWYCLVVFLATYL